MADLGITSPADLIDLKQYPITQPKSAEYQKLISHCREQLGKLGACVLPQFITKEATLAMAREAARLAPLAYHNTLTGNAYLTENEDGFDKEHPRKATATTALGAVAYDQIEPEALVRQIYEWDTLMHFLRDALSKEKLFRYADPMGGLNIAVMKEGDHLRWHFDQTDFVTTILLQASKAGGEYEFVPHIRTAINENYKHVKAILNGSNEGVIKLEIEPGSLVLFEGRNSLHRVTPIEGDVPRYIALFGYDTRPDVVSSDYLRQIRYGRTK